jgi:hypothetical protein
VPRYTRNGIVKLLTNRRIMERGLLDSDRDFRFLTWYELYDVLDGKANMTLACAKLEERRRNFDAFDSKEYMPPKFLYRNRELDESETSEGNRSSAGLPPAAAPSPAPHAWSNSSRRSARSTLAKSSSSTARTRAGRPSTGTLVKSASTMTTPTPTLQRTARPNSPASATE